jgi:DNA-binding response OmpR family regulator
MGREPKSKPLLVLHIGQIDPAHQKLWEQLQREGIAMAFARTLKAGLEKALELQPQVVIINGVHGHFSTVRLCQLLSVRLPKARRLVVTDDTLGEIPCEIRLHHPFSIHKLRKSLFDLFQDPAARIVEAGAFRLDVLARTIAGPAGEHHLTPKQTKLLASFMERPNQVISRGDLMSLIWETRYVGDTRTLDVHIRWLREKIEANPKHPMSLLTKRGVGYVLVIEEPVSVGSPAEEPLADEPVEVE